MVEERVFLFRRELLVSQIFRVIKYLFPPDVTTFFFRGEGGGRVGLVALKCFGSMPLYRSNVFGFIMLRLKIAHVRSTILLGKSLNIMK